MRGRRWRWLLGGILAVLLAVVAVVAVAYPAVAATTCPGCYGLEQARPGLHVEPGLTAAQRQQVADAVEEGTRRVADYFGGLRSDPARGYGGPLHGVAHRAAARDPG